MGRRIYNEGSTVTWQKLARAGYTKFVFEIDELLSAVAPVQPAGGAVLRRRHHRALLPERGRGRRDHRSTVRSRPLDQLDRPRPSCCRTKCRGWLLEGEKSAAPDPELVTIVWRSGA